MELIALSFVGTLALLFGQGVTLVRERLRRRPRPVFPRAAFDVAPDVS